MFFYLFFCRENWMRNWGKLTFLFHDNRNLKSPIQGFLEIPIGIFWPKLKFVSIEIRGKSFKVFCVKNSISPVPLHFGSVPYKNVMCGRINFWSKVRIFKFLKVKLYFFQHFSNYCQNFVNLTNLSLIRIIVVCSNKVFSTKCFWHQMKNAWPIREKVLPFLLSWTKV